MTNSNGNGKAWIRCSIDGCNDYVCIDTEYCERHTYSRYKAVLPSMYKEARSPKYHLGIYE